MASCGAVAVRESRYSNRGDSRGDRPVAPTGVFTVTPAPSAPPCCPRPSSRDASQAGAGPAAHAWDSSPISSHRRLRTSESRAPVKDGASARLEDSKTGPRTIWFGPDAARLVADLPRPEGAERVFPEDLTSDRLYAFWVTIRQDAGLPSLRIHDCRHTWASQGVMNGVGLQTVGRSLGHRKRRSTAIYAHLDDAASQDAATQAAAAVADAMGYRAGRRRRPTRRRASRRAACGLPLPKATHDRPLGP